VYGDAYRRYKRQVPSILPVRFGRETGENKPNELNPGAVPQTVEYPGN